MRNIDEKKYEQYVKQLTPTHSLPLNMAKAFLTGGLICLLGQVIIKHQHRLSVQTLPMPEPGVLYFSSS